jgi:catechol 2,3-dioxygenase-like lactoylglutathione lyase family enzyme
MILRGYISKRSLYKGNAMFLEHVNLTVSDLDRSRSLYCDLLGLRVRWEGKAISSMGPVRAVHIGDDRGYLALFEAAREGRAPKDYDRPGVNHFGFVVDDLEAVRRRLVERGFTPHFEADYEPGRRLYFHDPDGVEVEFVEYARG